MHQALFQTLYRQQTKIICDGHRFAIGEGRGVVGQLRFAQNQRQVAALGNFDGVGQGTGHIGKQCLHFSGRFEVLIASELSNTTLVAQNFAFGNAHACFVRFVIVLFQKLNWMRGHHWQAQTRSQLDGSHHVGVVFRTTCALNFQIETVRKNRRQLQSNFGRTRCITLHQGLTHRASLRTRQQNQTIRQFLKPRQLDHGVGLHHVLRPSAGQQFGQVQIALRTLHQHHDP